MGENMTNEETLKVVASKAAKILGNPKSSVMAKSVAGSVLKQATHRPDSYRNTRRVGGGRIKGRDYPGYGR